MKLGFFGSDLIPCTHAVSEELLNRVCEELWNRYRLPYKSTVTEDGFRLEYYVKVPEKRYGTCPTVHAVRDGDAYRMTLTVSGSAKRQWCAWLGFVVMVQIICIWFRFWQLAIVDSIFYIYAIPPFFYTKRCRKKLHTVLARYL